MAVQITIRNVPQPVKDDLAARAAREGKSMQEYLLGELERLTRRPSPAEWLASLRARKAAAPTRVSPQEILRHRDADRR
jgi:plasmid stability protein